MEAAYNNKATEDLEVSNIRRAMNSWLNQSHYPILNVERFEDREIVTISTQNTSDTWWIPVTYNMQTQINFNNTLDQFWIRSYLSLSYDKPIKRVISTPNLKANWIIFNLQQTGYPLTVGKINVPISIKYPYQVSLTKFGFYVCSGSIISQNTILTAAHCIIHYEKNPGALKELTIHAGTTGTVYKAKRAISHKDFLDNFRFVNNIGLLILSTPIKYTPQIEPIPLATTDVAPAGSACTLLGWGRILPDRLVLDKEIELSVYDQAECKRKHRNVESTHICALMITGEVCMLDSGGPLVAKGVQIGIFAFGPPCAGGSPDVFTRVTAFKDWIQKHIVE